MKKKVLFLILFMGTVIPGILKAQYAIPNGSFENWTTTNKPASWTVVQGKPTQGHLYTYYVVDNQGDTLRYENYAKDGTSFIDIPMLDTASPCIISQKFPMTARPRYFSMNYAYFPETYQNQFQVSFFFTKWNTSSSKEDTILAGDYNSKPGDTALPWTTLLVADLSTLYNPNFTSSPDSGFITISSSLQNSSNDKTVLIIDEIYFTDTVVSAGVKPTQNKSLTTSKSFVYPNPFSDKTTIKYYLANSGQVLIHVYDENGKIVSTLVNCNQETGNHEAIFNGSNLPDGIYFYQLQSEHDTETGKLILSR